MLHISRNPKFHASNAATAEQLYITLSSSFHKVLLNVFLNSLCIVHMFCYDVKKMARKGNQVNLFANFITFRFFLFAPH